MGLVGVTCSLKETSGDCSALTVGQVTNGQAIGTSDTDRPIVRSRADVTMGSHRRTENNSYTHVFISRSSGVESTCKRNQPLPPKRVITMTDFNTEAATITDAELADIVGGCALDAKLELDAQAPLAAKLDAGLDWH